MIQPSCGDGAFRPDLAKPLAGREVAVKKVPVETIFEYFGDLSDPRVERTKHHKLLDILVIALCAVICGANGWVGVEQFGLSKLKWFRKVTDQAAPP